MATVAFIGCLGLWFASLGWLLVTNACAILQPWKRRRPAPRTTRPISIIVSSSASSDERAARDRDMAVASLLELQYPAFEVVISIDRGEQQSELLDELRQRHASTKVLLVVASRQASPNAKVDAMAAGAGHAQHQTLLFSDDDIIVDRTHLLRLTAQLRDETIGLVSAAAFGTDPTNFWGDVEVAFMNGQFARLHLAGDFLGFSGALGKAILVGKDNLARAGGVYRIGSDCCEDAALARNIKAVGLKVALSDRPVLQPVGDQHFVDVWRRHRRWLSCRRRYLPVIFAFEGLFCVATSCLAGGVISAHLLDDAVPGIVGTLLLWCAMDLALRFLKGWHIGMLTPWAWAARELLFVPMWLSALWARTVIWYGRQVPVAATSDY